MKEIYSFTVDRKTKVKKEEITDNGVLIKEVEEKTPIKIVIKKPSRIDQEEAQMVYSVELSRCIKLGLLTKAMIAKMYNNDGGILSKEQAKEYEEINKSLLDKLVDYRELIVNKEETEEYKERVVKVRAELQEIQDKLAEYEDIAREIFDNAADSKARNRQLFWWILHLTYIQEGDRLPALFPSDKDEPENYRERCKKWDELSELDDPFYNEVLNQVSLVVSLWFFGKAETVEDFNEFFFNLKGETGDSDKLPEKQTEKTENE